MCYCFGVCEEWCYGCVYGVRYCERVCSCWVLGEGGVGIEGFYLFLFIGCYCWKICDVIGVLFVK